MRQRRYRAFTLLELLLAMLLSATIAGSLAASLYIAYRARTSAEAAVEESHVADALGDIVARDLAVALPPTGILAGTFMGQADLVGFYISGAEPRAALQAGCRYIEFGLAADPNIPGSDMLVRRVATNLLAPVQPEPVEERICRNVEQLSFQYCDGSQWLDTWDSTQQNNTLPVAVQITVTLRPRVEGGAPIQMTRIVRLACGVAATTAEGG